MAPERTCVVCRNRRPKGELVRVVRSPSGEVTVDPAGNAPGRGAYVCRRPGHAAEAGARLALALRATLGEVDLARLRREMEKEIE